MRPCAFTWTELPVSKSTAAPLGEILTKGVSAFRTPQVDSTAVLSLVTSHGAGSDLWWTRARQSWTLLHRSLTLFAALYMLSNQSAARADEVLVSAASSLTNAMNEIGAAYTKANPRTTVRFNFGASGALQQQIALGAPVDVFASASPNEMDALQRMNRIEAATRSDFAGNRLVLIAPARSTLNHWNDLRSPRVGRIAISNPASVPSGRYGQDVLTARGLWKVVQPKCIYGENVRQTLTYVSGGNVDAGIVFATDAQAERQRVRVVEEAVPGQDHPPIVYPAAVMAGAPNATAARRFVVFLQSPTVQRILARYGFTPAHSIPVLRQVAPRRTSAIHNPAARADIR